MIDDKDILIEVNNSKDQDQEVTSSQTQEMGQGLF
jgi:hypothetical protein